MPFLQCHSRIRKLSRNFTRLRRSTNSNTIRLRCMFLHTVSGISLELPVTRLNFHVITTFSQHGNFRTPRTTAATRPVPRAATRSTATAASPTSVTAARATTATPARTASHCRVACTASARRPTSASACQGGRGFSARKVMLLRGLG